MDKKFTYLIKRLGSQELGSQAYRGGRANRGRYILISKDQEFQSLFPYLSGTEENDCSFITLLPLFSNENFKRIYCKYIYHNSKQAFDQANGRDEKRIYLQKEIDDNQFYKDDYIILRRDYSRDKDRTAKNFDYLIDWLKPSDPLYKSISNLSFSYKKGNFYLYEGNLRFFEDKVPNNAETEVEITEDIKKSATEKVQQQALFPPIDAHRTGLETFASLFNSVSFRDFVLKNYNYNCAVTNEVISYKELNNLEAAHIHPKCHGGEFLPTNGIAMRRDIHWAFDKGMFYIDADLNIHVAPEVKGSYLGRYDGKKITPVTEAFRPSPKYLEYHQQHIYGLFKTTGSMV